jgi:uncharacterized protein
MKKAILVHGWDGNPNNCWFPWLREELLKLGYEVTIPCMPHPEKPTIKDWVAQLASAADGINKESILIGHSIGCQTILRFLEQSNKKIKATFLVAPFFELDLTDETEEEEAIAKPWKETPIDFIKVKESCPYFYSMFSDDDPYIPLNNVDLFKERINSETLVLHNRAHFEIYKDLPELLEAIQKLNK